MLDPCSETALLKYLWVWTVNVCGVGVQKDTLKLPENGLVLLVPASSFRGSREELRSDFLTRVCWKLLWASPLLFQVFGKGPHLSCTQTLHKAPSLPPPSHRSGQTEPWPQKRENRIVAFQFYYIMRCHIPHNSPYICAPGRNPEEFCLFYCICSPGTKIGIHPPRDSLQM